MYNKLIIGFLLSSFFTLTLSSQNVTKVSFQQKGQKLEISYSLIGGSFNQKFNVSLFVSTDGGATYNGPMQSVTGDVGFGILKGSGYKILWDVYKDMPAFGGDVAIEVRATVIEEKVKRKIYVGYKGSYNAPLGAVIGLTGTPGFYVSARMNPGFSENYNYDTDGEVLAGFPESGYYAFTGSDMERNISVTGGLSFQVSRIMHVLIGGGYTLYDLLWEYEEYAYPDQSRGKYWAKDTRESFSGVELEAGLMLQFNPVFITGGVNVLNFSYVEGNVGIGVIF